MKKTLFFCFIVTVLSGSVHAQTVIAAKDASKHIGETVSITATVFGGKAFAPSNMILLDLGGANPNQELTLMIPATARDKFKGQPDVDYKGKEVTVTGKIIDYKGKPEIELSSPDQLRVVMKDNVKKQRFN